MFCYSRFVFAVLALLVAGACTPTIKVAPPDKPIEINLNIRIDQEVRVKIDKELDDLFASNPGAFGAAAQ